MLTIPIIYSHLELNIISLLGKLSITGLQFQP